MIRPHVTAPLRLVAVMMAVIVAPFAAPAGDTPSAMPAARSSRATSSSSLRASRARQDMVTHRPTERAAPGASDPAPPAPEPPASQESGPLRVAPASSTSPSPVCFDCFWLYQPASLREDLKVYYRTHPSMDPLLDADRSYLLARMTGDHDALCAARERFLGAAHALTGARKLLAMETVAFTAEECGASPGESFSAAADSARSAGESWKADVYARLAAGEFQPTFGEAAIGTSAMSVAHANAFVLGESAIRVKSGARVGVQIERTVRDWLSNQFLYDLSGAPPKTGAILPYHEGSRLRDILGAGPVRIQPLSGALAVRHGERWLAADESGVFRYEVLPDKVQYPTTRVWKDLALLVDTHGISALVERAVHARSDLVIGCGDSRDKMAAAYHLASRGIDVYFPCDRFVAEVLAHDAKGTLIGSAPVRRTGSGTVIGDQPVTFALTETIVAEDALLRGPFQYYDAPARYFRKLAQIVPLHLEIVLVDGPGQSSRVVDRARELGSTAIGVRVQTSQDAAPVRSWLRASSRNRAVLFHTAPYPDGYALFREFPLQTTFGDPRPRFFERDTAEPISCSSRPSSAPGPQSTSRTGRY